MTHDPAPNTPVTIVIGDRRYDGIVLQSLCTGEVRVRTPITVWTVPCANVVPRKVAA